MQRKIIFSVLFILFVLDLFFIWNDTPIFRFFTKPLLIPILLLGYFSELKSKQIKMNLWFVLGLVFSFFGDLFLLFSWGFILGLGSFLLAHIFYIICLNKFKINSSWTFLPFVMLYLISFLYYLFPHLNEMKIPVIFYAITISLMFFASIRTKKLLLILGACLFVISDSILSISLFVNPSKILSLFVMITYISAQYLLVQGVLKSDK